MINSNRKLGLLTVGIVLASLMSVTKTEAAVFPLSDRWLRDIDDDDIGDQQRPEGNPQLIMGDGIQGEMRAGFLFDITAENAGAATQITLSVTVGDIAFLPLITGSGPDFRLVHVAQADYSGSVEGNTASLNSENNSILKGTYAALGTTVIGSLSGHDPDNDGIILGADVTGPDNTNPSDTTPGDSLVWDVTSLVQADKLDSLELSLFRLEAANPADFNGDSVHNIQWWSGNGGTNATAAGLGLGVEVLPQLNFTIPIIDGDFDSDGDVDGADYLFWQRGGVSSPPSAIDLAKWKTNFGSPSSVLTTSTAIPEPTTFCLLLMMGGLLAFNGRR